MSRTRSSESPTVRTTPLPPWPHFDEAFQDAVTQVLASGKVNQWTGTEVKAMEAEWAEYLGVQYAVAVMNGSVAIELALRALGVGPGDEVVVTPRSFMASVSSVVMIGAVPVFADVDPVTGNLTAETIEAVLTERTRAVIPVHLAGWPCDMDPIMDLASSKGLFVIEDCAQAHGAEYRGRKVGSIGHMGCFSFCQDKIVTTGGEGGLVTTNDEELWKRAWQFKDHGKDYDMVFNTEHPPGFRWLHAAFGTNWRMTEMQAAIGRVALERLPEWLRTRRRHVETISRHLRPIEAFLIPTPSDDVRHAYYKFYWLVRPDALANGWDRDRIVAEVNALGLPLYSGSCSEIYKEAAFDGTGYRPSTPLPNAHTIGTLSLMTLVHPTMTDADADEIGRGIAAVMANAIAPSVPA